MDTNVVALSGTLTGTEYVQFEKSGKTKLRLKVKVLTGYTDDDGKEQVSTNYVKVDVWNPDPESELLFLPTGVRVKVDGSVSVYKGHTNINAPADGIVIGERVGQEPRLIEASSS